MSPVHAALRRRRDRAPARTRRSSDVLGHGRPQLVLVLSTACRTPAMSARSSAPPKACGATGIICTRRHRRSVRLEGAARRDGQHVPAADRRRASRSPDVDRARAGDGAARSSPRCRAAARRCRAATSGSRRPSCSAAKEPGCPTSRRRARGRAAHDSDARPVESLNVAIAAALILYEAAQRQPGAHPDVAVRRAGDRRNPALRSVGAARRADAAAHARRVRRAGRADRARPAAARGDRAATGCSRSSSGARRAPARRRWRA